MVAVLDIHPAISLFPRVIETGMHRGFHCVVFDLCNSTLHDMVNGYCGLTPLPAMHVMEISYQLVQAITCKLPSFSQHWCGKVDPVPSRLAFRWDHPWGPQVGQYCSQIRRHR